MYAVIPLHRYCDVAETSLCATEIRYRIQRYIAVCDGNDNGGNDNNYGNNASQNYNNDYDDDETYNNDKAK